MRIDGLGPQLPIQPLNPPPPPAPAAGQSATSVTSLVNQAILQQEQTGGGGGGGGHGHGGGGGKKGAMEAIDDIAARATLNVEQRERSVLDRMREIERLKAQMAAQNEQVGEKSGDGEKGKSDDDASTGEDGDEDASETA